MAKDTIGYALSAASKLAGSSLVGKLKLRKPAEKFAYISTRTGFQVISTANARVQQAKNFFKPIAGTNNNGGTAPFDLSLSEEQQLIVESLGHFADDKIRPSAYEADDTSTTPEALFSQAHELGLLSYTIPESLGGYATEKDATTTHFLIVEALANGDMGIATALLSTVSVANAITRWGTEEQQANWLTPLLTSADQAPAITASIAINEPSPLFTPNNLQTTITPNEEGYRLNGSKSAVIIGERADFFLVAATGSNDRRQLFIVNSALKGISIEAEHSMGLKAAGLCNITFNDVQLPDDALLGDESFCYQSFIDMANLSLCALAIGCGKAIQDYVINYCNERTAFGEPISHRQSVAFMIANIGIELESMRLLAYRAASRVEQGLPFHREAYLAKVLCSDKAMEIGTNGVQLLGGHGFIKEHPLERWYRDMRAIAIVYGLHC